MQASNWNDWNAALQERKHMSQLRKARVKAGLTLQALASQAGMSRTTIEKAEKGKEAISEIYANRIINALNSLSGDSYTVKDLEIVISEQIRES